MAGVCEETSLLGLRETLIDTLSLAHTNMIFQDCLGVDLLGNFISDTIKLVLLHFASNRCARVLRLCFLFFFLLLLLNLSWLVVDGVASEHRVEFLEEQVSCVGSAVNDRVVILNGDIEAFALAEFAQVNPVVCLFFQLKAIVKLVHLNFVGIEALEDLSEDPTVGEVTFGISDLVGHVK